MSALVFPAQPHRRSTRKLKSWWGRAFWRAVEELAYDDGQLLQARALARSGRIGGVLVDTGRLAAGIAEEAGIWTVAAVVPPLDTEARAAFLEVVGGDVGAILGGDLPHALVEHAEEAGVELVPYGSELSATCSCPQWRRLSRQGHVCEHALGVLAQVADLVDQDPLVLLQLRGIARDDLLPLRAAAPEGGSVRTPTSDVGHGEVAHGEDDGEEADEVEIALDAALRAARLLEESGMDPASDDVG